MAAVVTRENASADRSLAILQTLFGQRYAREFAIELWDGTRVEATGMRLFTLRINEPFALRAAFAPPLDLGPGRAFVEKWIDIDGDIEAAIQIMEGAMAAFPRLALPKMIAQLLLLPKAPPASDEGVQLKGKRHSKKRDAAAIGFHYDQPIAFYRSFLDSRMVYSCGYWDDGVQTLDEAQVAKIDHTLRKVRLRPGERLLDIGCGWGALVIRAAQQFGAHALGVTLSRRQHEEAQRRIAEAGVGDKVRVELRDYRDLRGETFDKIVSVGMVEHVGRERLATYFRTAYDALRDGGLFLNHGITQQTRDGKGYRVSGFMDRYVCASIMRRRCARGIRISRCGAMRSSPPPTSAPIASGKSTWRAARVTSGGARWASSKRCSPRPRAADRRRFRRRGATSTPKAVKRAANRRLS
jgi:cyclopropane-fatty-acyl-phospholipid synthase